jgi:Na+-driven multidrug efflux pump
MQFAECINVSNQSLAATALGSGDTQYALDVVKRHVLYAVTLVSVIGGLVLLFKAQIVGLFTTDAAVVATAFSVLPLLVGVFPVDGLMSIVDGTLTAAG